MGVLLEELALLLLVGKKREDQPGGMRMVALGWGLGGGVADESMFVTRNRRQ